MGNHIILGLLGVRMIAIRLLVVVACLCAFAPSSIEAKKKVKRTEDVFCDGKKKFEVYLKAGKNYKFETAMKPKKNTKCVVNYKLENGCKNVRIWKVQYSLNDEKACYKRITGNNKKGKGEVQVDFCGVPSGEEWDHTVVTIPTDVNGVHMHGGTGSITDVPDAISEDFTIIFTQKEASGSFMKHLISCGDGIEEPELNQGCRCGMKKNETAFTLPTASWMVKYLGTMEYGGEKHEDFEFPAVLVADRWIVVADEIDNFDPIDPSGLKIPGRNSSEEWGTSGSPMKIGKLTINQIEEDNNFRLLLDLNDHSPVCLPTSAVLETGKIKKLLTYGHQYDTDAGDFEEDPVDVKLKVLKRETCEKILAKTNREPLGDDEECVVPLKKKGNTVCERDLGVPIFHTQLGKDMENFVIYGFVIEFGKASHCANKKNPARIQKICQDTLDFVEGKADSQEAYTCSPYAPFNNCKASNGTEFFCATRDESGNRQQCCGDVCGPVCNLAIEGECNNGECGACLHDHCEESNGGQCCYLNEICPNGATTCDCPKKCGPISSPSCCAPTETCINGACVPIPVEEWDIY